MEVVQIQRYKRNPDKIKSYFKTKGEITTVTKDIQVVFPERYINKKLAKIDEDVKLLSLYAIMDDNFNYAVVNAPIIQILSPSTTNDVTIDSTKYISLTFEEGSVFMPTNNLVTSESFIYDLFDEFIVQGKIPWYLSYNDLSNILLEAKKYAGSNIAKDPLSFEIIASIVARNVNDKKVYFRHIVTDKNMDKIKPTYVGLNNVFYSFDNTGAKLIGSRFGDGMISAIVDPETKTSATSDILRS